MAGGEWSRAIAVAAFVASYVGLGLGRVPPFRVDRTGVAIIGAAAMVASGALPWPDAVASVDAPTLVLLFGMMIVTAYLRLSGFFHLVTTWTLRRARTPRALLAAVIVASGVLSAFFVNDDREQGARDRKSTRLNSSHVRISYAVFCLKKKNDCTAAWTSRFPKLPTGH